ncbi:unnamed protein product, partial [Trichogramma brassicae]
MREFSMRENLGRILRIHSNVRTAGISIHPHPPSSVTTIQLLRYRQHQPTRGRDDPYRRPTRGDPRFSELLGIRTENRSLLISSSSLQQSATCSDRQRSKPSEVNHARVDSGGTAAARQNPPKWPALFHRAPASTAAAPETQATGTPEDPRRRRGASSWEMEDPDDLRPEPDGHRRRRLLLLVSRSARRRDAEEGRPLATRWSESILKIKFDETRKSCGT